MTLKSVQFVRGRDGSQRVLLDLAEFQALVDAASAAEFGAVNVKSVVDGLRAVLAGDNEYIDASEFLAGYDAAHDPH